MLGGAEESAARGSVWAAAGGVLGADRAWGFGATSSLGCGGRLLLQGSSLSEMLQQVLADGGRLSRLP